MSYQDAEAYLMEEEKDGCFIVRISGSKKYYVLTLYSKDPRPSITHNNIIQSTSGRFYLESQRSQAFSTLPQLVDAHFQEAGCLKTRLKCTPKGISRQTAVRPPPAIVLHPERKSEVAKDRRDSRNLWEIHQSELNLCGRLGSGSFGEVHQAKFRGSVLVAVKILKSGVMSEEDFIKEAQMMTELKHPHIVRLCGICIAPRPICIVTEFMKYGSLLKYLNKYKKTLLEKHNALLNICAQVSRGMAYLEEKQFIHRDLCARNCLVGSNGIVKVADFGMSKFMDSDHYHGSDESLIAYNTSPPEVLSSRLFSSKSDVWAFGILMWEVFTCGLNPYGSLLKQDVVRLVGRGYILDHPKAANKHEYDMMSRCWAYNPQDRPPFWKLRNCLVAMVEYMEKD